jgi:catechol 2,3-dioxygenase-like lactoylglutathione lyase family enzyme
MPILGIEKITYGVDDIDECTRYLVDWGFHYSDSHDDKCKVFFTEEKTQIILRQTNNVRLPTLHHKSPFFKGSCAREVIWGVDRLESLDKIKINLQQDRQISIDSDGVLHSTDIAHNPIGFSVTQRTPVIQAPLQFNLVGRPVRINQSAEGSQKILSTHPLRINHVVYLAPSPEAAKQASDFYIQRLDFKLSDNVGNKGFFMRASASNDHHNLLFECHGPDYFGLQHSAFEFRDIDHIMHCGRRLEMRGWKSHNGPGRHTVGSNLTWYFWSPLGGLMELISDMDYVTDEWQPRFIDPLKAGPPISWSARPNAPDFKFGFPTA